MFAVLYQEIFLLRWLKLNKLTKRLHTSQQLYSIYEIAVFLQYNFNY